MTESTSPRLKINHVIVCDDVRREDNGKLILIGVYSKDIGFGQMPAQFAPALFVELDYMKEGSAKVEFRGILLPKETVLFRVGADINVAKPEQNASLTVGQVPMLIGDSGVLEIQFCEDGGDWNVIKTIPIVSRPRASSTAQKQPS